MQLPYMTSSTGKTRRQTISFGGLNYSLATSDGELADSEALSAALAPALSQRKGRRTEGTYTGPTALYARGKLLVVDGTRLLYGGKDVGSVSPGEKMMATINTKVCIWPDKVYLDTTTEELHPLALELELPAGVVSFTANTLTVGKASYWQDEEQEETREVSLADGAAVTVYSGPVVDRYTGELSWEHQASTTPNGLVRGQIITEGCGSGEYLVVGTVVRQESKATASYLVTGQIHKAVEHDYAALEELIQAGDAIEISGCTTCGDNNGSHLVRSVAGSVLTFDADIFGQTGTETAAVTLERKVPDLVCLCECDNRIWGAEGQTIYASALGDPRNFFVYDGLSTDSYSAAVGTDGEFTGCIAYSSTVLFSKEDYLHKVLGSYPAQYEIYTYKVPGVQAGAEKSLVSINETLYFQGRGGGIYAYAGGVPELLSEKFGERKFSGGVAGTDGERYYISMQDEQGAWQLYVYDPRKGYWLREDGSRVLDWAYLDGTLYYLDGDKGSVVATGQEEDEDGPIPWSMTLCQMDETTHGRKSYSKLYLRADLAANAWFKVEVRTDGGAWKQVFLTHNERERTVQVPILPTRCDCFQIRISGKGGCVLKSLVREFAVGSEW